MIGKKIPGVVFRTRVRDGSLGGDNPYRWQDIESSEYFSNQRANKFKNL